MNVTGIGTFYSTVECAYRPTNLRRPLVGRRIARLEVLGRLRLRRRGGGRRKAASE